MWTGDDGIQELARPCRNFGQMAVGQMAVKRCGEVIWRMTVPKRKLVNLVSICLICFSSGDVSGEITGNHDCLVAKTKL